jgi:uncharacterized membrane protein (UPF0127 family)
MSQSKILLNKVYVADSFFPKFAGLIFRKRLKTDEGLLICSCNSVHTFWMRYPIDAIFLDDKFKVVYMIENIKPFSVTPFIKDSKYVLELLSLTAKKLGIVSGNYLGFY